MLFAAGKVPDGTPGEARHAHHFEGFVHPRPVCFARLAEEAGDDDGLQGLTVYLSTASGEPIALARLSAYPTAMRCLACQERYVQFARLMATLLEAQVPLPNAVASACAQACRSRQVVPSDVPDGHSLAVSTSG